MNEAFSEYVLYEPMLRILAARGYTVECEYECPGIEHAETGDKKRIDFHAIGHGLELAMEVKWIRSQNPKISGDLKKLAAFREAKPEGIALLCLFGRRSFLEGLELEENGLTERGKSRYADLGKTRYGCRIFELAH